MQMPSKSSSNGRGSLLASVKGSEQPFTVHTGDSSKERGRDASRQVSISFFFLELS